ncbi:sensor histidine kinase [Dactylosporangium matsuzakiense]|uniref:histidine kinase n=1 Tax=Dactylosporangium matsuzakiense TaxID=53360 RepID=A0A9W6KMN3_9ACTN|nr:HAMP domain-containing sensor histidine kinase [Dactylosporangium matsuzakiense]GLL03066.1 two-component sensor histidine kinase [Dactylosporangium matsuzakiense]
MRRHAERIRQRLGVRMRSALAASAVVAVASVLTGVAFVLAARFILTRDADQDVDDRAAQIAGTLGDEQALAAMIQPSLRDSAVVQILGADGAVLRSSTLLNGAPPISALRPAAGETRREQRRLAVAHDDAFRITALGVATADGPRTVLVGRSLDEIDDGTEAAIGALAIGLPLLTVTVGVATFLFVGRSLRPVDAMRRQADTITGRSLHTRLPVPPAADEIAALAATMNGMLDRIEAATAAQRRFVADASHELRSPLSTVLAGLDLLGEGPHLDRMRREGDRMARLVADLLLLARVDEKGLQLRREDVDLDDLVYLERERLAAEHPGLQVTARTAPVRLSGDPHHLQRVLRNLVDNAARYAKHTVEVTLEARDGTAEVTVTDDGPGIAPADRSRVFDRFVRLDADRSRSGGGTGLGLPIARDIVTGHGGTLTVEEARTGGATLRLCLPLTR